MKTVASNGIGCRLAGLFCGAALAALAFPATALAQVGEEEPEPEMAEAAPPASHTEEAAFGNEILVTATKREQALQDVPMAVSVATAEAIGRAQIRDLPDLQMLLPSLRVVQLQSSAVTNFFIRGFGNGSNNVGIEPSVGVFIDGVYRSRSAAQISDFPDIQRVEVLRGPQSTLFGKNASAGVVSIITREPQFDFGGSIEASYGNYDAKVIKGYVTGPVSQNVAVSLAAGLNKRDGYIRDLGNGTRTNERNRWFLRGQALYGNDSGLKVRLTADFDEIDENCCGVLNVRSSAATDALRLLGGQVNDPSDRFADRVYTNFPSTNRFRNYGVSGHVDYALGPLNVTSITALRRSDVLTNQDSDFTSARLLDRNFMDQDLKTFTQELRLSANFLDKFSALLGVFYLNEKVDQRNELQLGTQFRSYADLQIRGGTGNALNVGLLEGAFGALEGDPGKYLGRFFVPGTGLDERYRLRNEAFSVFGQIDFEVIDRLTLTVGGNFTTDRKRFRTNVISDETFSAIDLNAPQYAPFRQQLLLGAGLAQAGVNSGDPAAVAAFAANPATAPVYQQIHAFAAANAGNPLANPLGALRPLQLFPPFLNLPNAVERGRTGDNDFSYTIRLAYDASENLNLYAGYATGFKASSINLSRDSRPSAGLAGALGAAGLTTPNLRFGSRFAGPEDSRAFELGAKGNWRNYSANIALFHQAIKGFQSNIFTGTGFMLANAGKQSTYGIEFEATARPVEQLSLGLSLVYLDAKYNDFPLSALGDQSGRRVTEVPEFGGTVTAEWNQPVGNGDHVILRGAYHYESRAWAVEGLPGFIQRDAAGNVISYQPGFDAARPFKRQVDELDASLTYAFDSGLEVTVWGRNLLNDRYLNRLFDSVAQPLAISGYPNVPRTYGVSARYRW